MTDTSSANPSPSPPKERRTDLWILGGVLGFGLVFILGATWLGLQKRTRYKLDPPAALTPQEERVLGVLGVLTPRFPQMTGWVDPPAEIEEELDARFTASVDVRENPDHYRDLALFRLLEGRPVDGLIAISLAVEHHPDRAELRLIQGILLEATGRDGALAAFRAAERTLGDDPDLLYRLGRLYLARHEFEQALFYAERTAKVLPNAAEAQFLLGEACLAIGDPGRAKRAFLNVLQLRPEDAEARGHVRRLDGT